MVPTVTATAAAAAAAAVPNKAAKRSKRPAAAAAAAGAGAAGAAVASATKKTKKKADPCISNSSGTASAVAFSAGNVQHAKAAVAATGSAALSPPTRTLVLDNGGDTVKYGWCVHVAGVGQDAAGAAAAAADATVVQHMPNVTARLPQQWTVLVGDEIHTQVTNPNACIAVTRSTERGIITNMGNQIQVWKRILDVLGVVVVVGGMNESNNIGGSTNKSETAAAFGWNNNSNMSNAAAGKNKSSSAHQRATKKTVATNTTNTGKTIPSHQCAVLIGFAPHTPRSVLDHVLTVWLEDFGFLRAGFFVSAVAAALYRSIPLFARSNISDSAASAAAATHEEEEVIPIACVVDLGWSAIHVVPVYQDKVIVAASNNNNNITTIRRVPFGAHHLINILKYYASYRQWNLMDSAWILRDVFEKTAHVSLQFAQDMRTARKIPAGRRPYDLEYILPDYDTTFTGTVQIPEAVRAELEKQKQKDGEEDDDDEEDDEDYEENDMEEDEDVDDNNDEAADAIVVAEDSSDDEESPEELRKQLLQQREEERRRRELEAEQHQVLNITVERFAVAEALFRPSDVGLPSEWANLPQAIVQAIEACPTVYRAGLYRSIQLTGGLSYLPNLKERLEQELRALAPSQYPLSISCSESPVNQAFKGALKLASEEPYTKWSVSREEWDNSSKRGAWKRLIMTKGGYLV